MAGRSEYGPRVLGHRSILCSAADQRVNEWLNERLGRPEFMPIGPISLCSPDLHAILCEYHRRTGIPSLINTSYNIHEEPIVGTARDSFATQKSSGLDFLAIGDFLVSQALSNPVAWSAVQNVPVVD